MLAPSVVLYGSSGEQFVLSPVTQAQSGSLWLTRGATGLDMPSWDVAQVESPFVDGAVGVNSRALQKEVFLPLQIWGTSRNDVAATKRRIIRALVPDLLGSSPRLVYAERTSVTEMEPTREVSVRYSSGMEGDEGTDNGLTWMKFGIVLVTEGDPLWRASEESVYPFETAEAGDPFFPEVGGFVADEVDAGFKLSPDPVFTNVIEINNGGDIAAPPLFRIVGPHAGGVAFTRAATARLPEQTLSFVGLNLLAGEFLELDTTRGRVRLTGTNLDQTDLWSVFGTNPSFWSLDKGVNTVTVTGLDTGAAAYIRLRERYASA